MITIEERNAALDAAKALVLSGWCQGAMAKNALGGKTAYDRDDAVELCAVGATLRASGFGQMKLMAKALRGALVKLGFDPIINRYNDAPGRTKYEVAALFDHAKEEPL